MAEQVQLRRGTTVQHASFTGAVGEATYDTDLKTLVVHDGVTLGGFALVRQAAAATLTTLVVTLGLTVNAGGAAIAGGLTVSSGGAAITGNTSVASGTFTASGGAVALSPANANVVISPTGTGVVTIAPATTGTLNNVNIGGTTRGTLAATTGNFNSTLTTTSTFNCGGVLNQTAGGINVSGTRSSGPSSSFFMDWDGSAARFNTDGAAFRFLTGSGGDMEQVRFLHTASASRYHTFTGGNGTNPIWASSAGGLTITPASGQLTVNAAALGAGGMMMQVLDSAQTDTNSTRIEIGRAASSNQCAVIAYTYASGTPANSTAGMSVFGGSALTINGSGAVAAPAAFTAVGNITASLGSSGAISLFAGGDTHSYIQNASNGNVILRTGNGGVVLAHFVYAASASRYVTITPSNGGNPAISTSAGGLDLAQSTNIGTNSARYVTIIGSASGSPTISASAGGLDVASGVIFTNQTVASTVGAAGGASALPATPLGYWTTSINGTACKIPYYNT